MASETDVGVARSGLRLVFWAWLVETLLSAAVRLAYTTVKPGESMESARWIGLVGAASSLFFVLFAVALATGSFLLARAARGSVPWGACVAAGSLYALHSLLILAQMLMPATMRAAGAERYLEAMKMLGAGLAIVRLAGWGALALGIYGVGVEQERPPRDSLRIATTVAYTLAVAVMVVSIAFPRQDEAWLTAASLVGFAGNVVFLFFVGSAIRATPRAPDVTRDLPWARAASGLRVYGIGFILRGILVFLAFGLGASAGLGGMALVAIVAIPLISAAGGLLPLVGMALFTRLPPESRARGLAIAALVVAALATLADLVTAFSVLSAIDRWRSSSGPQTPAIGGVALLAGLVAICLFVAAQRRVASECGLPGLKRLAAVVLAGVLVAGICGGGALALLSRGATETVGLAALALATMVALASGVALVVLVFSLARALVLPKTA